MTQIVLSWWTKFSKNRPDTLFLLYICCLIFGLIYVSWRVFFTINFSQGIVSSIWSILLLVSEIYTFVMFSLFSFAAVSKGKTQIKSDKKDLIFFPSVDIFVCTYNENESILSDTLKGCLNIKYPNKKVYLLDDGNRKNIRDLAHRLGCNYISRENNKGFKAGNINNALKLTNGELIVVFDADHIPVSKFLFELVDFFKDMQVALVQTPQYFFNPDPFQKNLNLHKYIPNEQDLFFRVIQPGLSSWNATICSGTNFIVRREYLEQLGGIPQSTLTEDMDLGLRFQSIGYRVLYYNKPLAAGLSPETFKDYLNQRLRWAKGTMQIFLGESRRYLGKLNTVQKAFYISSLLYYFFGFPRLIFLLSPIVFLLFGIQPVSALFVQVALFQFTCYLSRMFLFDKVAKNKRNSFFTDVYESAVAFFLSFYVLKSMVIPFGEKFKVTNKGVKKANNDYSLLLPQLAIVILAVLGLVKGGFDYFNHLSNQYSILVNVFWNTYNIIILIFSINVALERLDPRKAQRVSVNKYSKIKNNNNLEIPANLVNLSKTGALLFSQKDITVELKTFFESASYMHISNSEKLAIKLVNTYEKRNGRYFHIKFADEKFSDDKILKIMYDSSENWK